MTTSYIESYVMGLPGVSNRRDFSGTNNSAASGTNTYGNINESKTNRDTKKTEENNKQAIKDIRLLAIRNLENSVTPGQIWVKMDETDARMGKNLFPNKTIVARNITANIDGNADGVELATLLTTNNNSNLQDGSIKRYHIVDSVIHPDTYIVVTPGKTFVLNDTNDIPSISIDYGDYYKSGTTVWLAVRSNEKQHEHNRKHTLEVKEVRNEAIRIRENSVTPGQIWVKMDETDPRMGKNLFPNKTIAARNITANIDGNANGVKLVTLLTTNENTNLKTGDKKRYHIVDSEIDRLTYETITPGKTFVLNDTTDIPTISIDYGDYYKSGTTVWLAVRSNEKQHEHNRKHTLEVKEVRNKAIRIRENSVTPGQIWVKMDETDPRMGKNFFPNKTIAARNITANIDGNADGAELATLLTTNENTNLKTGDKKRYHIVDSEIDRLTYETITPGKTFVLNETTDIPTISIDYGDYYKSGTTVWLAVRSNEKQHEHNRKHTLEVKEVRNEAIRIRENSVTPGQIWVKMDETDPRMGKNFFPNKTIADRNITTNIDGDATGAKLVTLLTTNENTNLKTGDKKRYHIVDSEIDRVTYETITYGKTFILLDTSDIPSLNPVIEYGDYYKSGTTVWLAVRSNEKQHEHNRKHTLEVKEVRNKAIRIRENSNIKGQIWVKMNQDNPRVLNDKYHLDKTYASRDITTTMDSNATGAELATLLTTNENANLKTGDKKRYHIVDSEIDRVTYETITYGKTFILLDTSDIPTLNPVIEYGDYYKDGTNVWMITNSYEVGRENARQIEIALEIKRNNDRTTETTGNGRSEAFQAWDPDGTLGRNWSLVSSFPANFTEANKVELTNSPLGNIRAVLEGGTTAFTITQLINTYGFGTANKIAIGEYIIHSSGSGSGYWIPLPVVNPSYASLLVVGGESRNDLLANFANGSSI